jgi:hypothetical protein
MIRRTEGWLRHDGDTSSISAGQHWVQVMLLNSKRVMEDGRIEPMTSSNPLTSWHEIQFSEETHSLVSRPGWTMHV